MQGPSRQVKTALRTQVDRVLGRGLCLCCRVEQDDDEDRPHAKGDDSQNEVGSRQEGAKEVETVSLDNSLEFQAENWGLSWRAVSLGHRDGAGHPERKGVLMWSGWATMSR